MVCDKVVCVLVCVKLLYVKFVCVKLWYVTCVEVEAGGGRREEEPGTQNQKQEPHTKLWWKNLDDYIIHIYILYIYIYVPSGINLLRGIPISDTDDEIIDWFSFPCSINPNKNAAKPTNTTITNTRYDQKHEGFKSHKRPGKSARPSSMQSPSHFPRTSALILLLSASCPIPGMWRLSQRF